MLELFFDSSGTVHMEFIPEGATVNKHHYKEILHRLRNSICCKCPVLRHRKNWLLHYEKPLNITLCLSKRNWQNKRSPFCHTLHINLISHYAISFSFPPYKKKAMWASISVSRGDQHCTREAVWDVPANTFRQFWQTCIAANSDYYDGGCGYV
jgi:hypothetical protein